MEEDFERIYNTYGNHLLRLCFLYLGEKSLAEDAFHETMVKVLCGFENFQGKSSEKTWLTRIAVNVCKDYLKSSWNRKVIYPKSLEAVSGSYEMQMEPEGELIRFILGLPVKYREVVLLYYYDECSVQEISQMLQVSVSAVTTRLERARKKLKIDMEGEGGYGKPITGAN